MENKMKKLLKAIIFSILFIATIHGYALATTPASCTAIRTGEALGRDQVPITSAWYSCVEGITFPNTFTIGWDGDLGTLTSAAVKSMVAPCTGKFTSLSCVATLTGACTTPPTVNVNNVTGATFGTATVLTTTVGTPVVAAQTLVFTSGNTIGLAQTATPGTCTVPRFSCQATMT